MIGAPASACGSRQNRGSRRRPSAGSHRSLQNARARFAFRTASTGHHHRVPRRRESGLSFQSLRRERDHLRKLRRRED